MVAEKGRNSLALLAGLALLVTAISAWLSPGWIPRILFVLSGGLVIAQHLSTGRGLMLMAPTFWLGQQAGLFYSVIPALIEWTWAGEGLWLPLHDAQMQAYFGSHVESEIMQFACLCLGAQVALGLLCQPPVPVSSQEGMRLRWTSVLALGLAVICLSEWAVSRLSGPAAVQAALHLFIPGWMAAGMVVLTLQATWSGQWRPLLLVAPIALGSQFLLWHGKHPLYLLGTLLVLSALRRPFRSSLRIMGLAVIALPLLLAGVTMARYELNYVGMDMSTSQRTATLVRYVLVAKLLKRQSESAACLADVLAEHGADGVGEPWYWAAALVPRVLWPEKPSLSLGSDYAVAYCGYAPEDVDRGGAGVHSASITLLGQPVIHGGLAGLRLAEAGLILTLAGAAVLARRHPAGLAAMAAMMPWLMDFDQDFALYLALAVKTLLLQSPILLFAGWCWRRL
ncbi:hypothetical protein WV31_12890 [Magnetospirillum sp. ME-1]|uniref:hypothetical protein n=1 Tax=Magnetospirillum sp. ME-1 TaxID=1639348 RepID=UPI000A17CD4E|nr:hypothetical protein [Magnetospirillum sp. ME-1]ARJ66501.1 hypothetical protein WV31_12890 [Magnetospirillum sp. ME-1]